MIPDLFRRAARAEPIRPQPLCSLAIDAEEDFDWLQPLPGTPYDTACMRHLGQPQSITGAYGLRPAYLLTYPVLQDVEAVRELRRYAERGDCVLGVQLHSWVTPPLEGDTDIRASFASNSSPALEERKLLRLMEAFRERFGVPPRMFRSGRYGIGPATPALLERYGFEVDVSLAPRTQATAEGGPDFSAVDCTPFWFGERRRVLEVPLCRSVVGWGGRIARDLYLSADSQFQTDSVRKPVHSLLTGLRAAERVTLSPEGNDLAAVRRLVDHLIDRGERVLTVSFHSSSLRPGRSPYVRSKRDLHLFYDRLSAILSYLSDRVGCRFTDLAALPKMMSDPLTGTKTSRG